MNILRRLWEKVTNIDKDDAVKWGCLIGAGALGILGNVFDTRKKDKEYRKEVSEAVKKRVAELKLNDGEQG